MNLLARFTGILAGTHLLINLLHQSSFRGVRVRIKRTFGAIFRMKDEFPDIMLKLYQYDALIFSIKKGSYAARIVSRFIP